ncbi:MAG: phage tail protein [Planctomycetes bacterium]|nr:phage tail protein [Planctomycetota bacterium]
MTPDYPLPSFHFKVTLFGADGTSDTSFQEVSGITSKITTESVIEGGENRYVHKLPTRVDHNNLVLKRGIAILASPLVRWCQSVFETPFDSPISPKNIIVSLLNEERKPARSWSFVNAYPVTWEVEAFQSQKNEVAIEKIELNYDYVNCKIPKP